MFTAVVIEDELFSRELLSKMIDTYCSGDIKVAALASSVEEGIYAINKYKPDIIFLDVELHTGTGFDVLMQFPDPGFDVIFTTAYNHYAVKAIKFSAVDYLLKPIDAVELQQAVQKLTEKRKTGLDTAALKSLMNNLQKPTDRAQTITLATSDGLEFVPLNQIIHIEANGPYSTFFLDDNRKIMVSKNLKEYEILLKDHLFLRIHNSHIINIKEVKRMIKADGGYAVMSNGVQLIISPKKKEEFLQMISEYNINL